MFLTSFSSFMLIIPCTFAATIPPTYRDVPQRPISFSTPSQHPISNSETRSDDVAHIRGTINIPTFVPEISKEINFRVSSQMCTPLIPEMPYVVSDLCQRLLSNHPEGISFPSSEMSPSIYISANITKQIYRSKFVLGLSLKLSSSQYGSEGIGKSSWMAIVALLERSMQHIDKEARMQTLEGVGSVVVVETQMGKIDVFAEWRSWRVIDGEAVLCGEIPNTTDDS